MTKPGSTLPRTIDAPDPTRRGPVLNVVLSARNIEMPASRYKLDGLVGVSVGRADTPSVERRVVDGGTRLELRFADGRVSSKHLELTRALGRWVAEDAGSRNGTFVNGEAVRRAVLVDGDILEVGDTFLQFVEAGALGEEPDAVTVSYDSGAARTTLLPTLASALARLPLVARSDESVLVRGASGTGKELIARAVHDLSGRRGAFVAVNCGALPEAMVEAELFGHKKGSFSGAAGERAGLVRAADGGTLFLDEIGDLRMSSQAALLRVLQEKQVRPIGSDTAVDVDLRVVCATHRPLDSLVADGDFRGDLLARLRGFVVELPDLRARRSDLGLLVAALLRRYQPQGPLPAISGAAVRALFAYAWPYNVRELEKCVSTALTLAAGGPIRLEHLPEPLRASAAALAARAPAAGPARPAASAPSVDASPGSADGDDEAEEATPGGDGTGEPRRVRLVRLMREYQGNVAAVARVMGKGRTQIHRWLERYGINPDEYR